MRFRCFGLCACRAPTKVDGPVRTISVADTLSIPPWTMKPCSSSVLALSHPCTCKLSISFIFQTRDDVFPTEPEKSNEGTKVKFNEQVLASKESTKEKIFSYEESVAPGARTSIGMFEIEILVATDDLKKGKSPVTGPKISRQ